MFYISCDKLDAPIHVLPQFERHSYLPMYIMFAVFCVWDIKLGLILRFWI